MTDEELMDSVIRLNDFLDSVFGMAKKVVFAGLIVGGASVATVVPIWPLVSQRPWNFASTGLLLLVAGGLTGAAVTLAATKGRTRRQLEARDRIIAAKDAEYKSIIAAKDAEYKSIIAAKDAEISELEDRPTRESVDSLKESHASALAAKDAEIESLRSPVETARRNIASLSDNELAMVGTLRRGPMKTSDYGEVLAHLSSLGIAEKLKNPGVFTPTWGITGDALSALREDDDLSKAADAAAESGLRDFEKERFLSESIRKLNPQQLGAVSIMFDDGHLDYREADSDPWGYTVDQGAEDLKELSSLNIARYMTLGNGSKRWSLTDHALQAIRDDQTLIEEGRKYIESICS